MEKAKTWIDSHVHLSGSLPGGAKKADFTEQLGDVLVRSGADLRFVISVDAVEMPAIVKDADAVLEGNRFIRDTAGSFPGRLYGSCTVNPRHMDASLRTMEECFEKFNFVMLGEMLQYMMDYEMNSAPVKRILRQAVTYGVPVQVHISTSNSGTHPSSFGTRQLRDLLGAAESVPEANYILAHLAGHSDLPVVEGYLEMIGRYSREWPDNFWVEIRDFDSNSVKTVLDGVPHERILAGTDYCTRGNPPFSDYGTVFDSRNTPRALTINRMAECLKEFGAGDETVKKISFANAFALFNLGGPCR